MMPRLVNASATEAASNAQTMPMTPTESLLAAVAAASAAASAATSSALPPASPQTATDTSQRSRGSRGYRPGAPSPSGHNFTIMMGPHGDQQISVVVLRHQGESGRHPTNPNLFYYQARIRHSYPQKHIWSGWAVWRAVIPSPPPARGLTVATLQHGAARVPGTDQGGRTAPH